MTHVLILLLASLTGIGAGLRAFTAPAVVSWAAFLDWLHLDGTWALWMGNSISVGLLTVLLVVELITDQLPKTPSRKTPPQFIAWLISGGFSAAVIGVAWAFTFPRRGAPDVERQGSRVATPVVLRVRAHRHGGQLGDE
jgi:uncharacterized membrane protein